MIQNIVLRNIDEKFSGESEKFDMLLKQIKDIISLRRRKLGFRADYCLCL